MDPKYSKIPFSRISDDVVFGTDVAIYGHVNLYGCTIGDECMIGSFVEIQNDVSIGNRVRVQSHTFICSHVDVEDDVFIGHNVCFINDRYPSAATANSGTWMAEPVRVCRGASIGSGSVIMCGITIGEGALVGAGSVVVSDVPPHAVVVGSPARVIRILPVEDSTLRKRTKSTDNAPEDQS